jgi:hypothetical protein
MNSKRQVTGKHRSAQGITLLVVFLLSLLIWRGYTPVVTNWFIGISVMAALITTEMALRGYPPGRAVLWGTASTLTVSALWAVVIPQLTGLSAHELALKEISNQIALVNRIYAQLGVSGQELDQIRQMLDYGSKVLSQIYPAMISINLFLASGFSLLLINRITKAVNLTTQPLFHSFKVPELLIWILIISGFSLFFEAPAIKIPALNLLILMVMLYFLQGLAVVLTIASRQAFGGVIKLFMTILIVFVPMLAMPPIAALGIFDLWGDFRTRKNKEQENL